MSRVYFVLDSTHGDYATVLSALATASANKYSFTPTQVVRTLSHDSNLKLVPANITLAERTGDLAPLARANEGIGVFIQELRDQPHKTAVAFDLLGESGYTAYFIKQNWAQASQGATPTSVSTGTGGRTFADAVAWEDFNSIVGRATDPIRVWILDDQIPVANSGWTAADLSLPFDDGTDANNRNQYRFDYPGHRGCMFGGVLLGSHVTWTDDGVSPGGGIGHIWSASLPANCESRGWAMDPGFDGNGNADPGEFGTFLTHRSTEALMQNNVNSHWASDYNSATTIKLHLPAGEDPTNRVLAPVRGNGVKAIGNISTLHQHIEFYECKRRMIGDIGQWVIDGARFLRGLNAENGLDVDGVAFGVSGSLCACVFIGLDSVARWGTAQAYTGWRIEGFRVRRSALGLLLDRQGATPNNTMDTGWYIEDIDGEDIGGHDPNYDHSDGMVVGFQGGAKNITIRGSLRCVNTGGPIQFYAFTQNDSDPANVIDQAFAGLDIDCTGVDIRDHPTYSTIAGTNNDVGIHFSGDADVSGDFSNISMTLTGTISGFSRGVRYKFGNQGTLTSHTNGGLIIQKGNSEQSGVVGIFCQVAAPIYEVTLSSSSGNWNVGDGLADPATPTNIAALITKVKGANPTVTLQYRGVNGTAPYFSDTETVANLDDTGTGTANGDGAFLGDLCGNLNYSNIDFKSDLDKFYEHVGTESPDGNAADGKAVGFHVQANNNIYRGTTTGKFDSLHGASQSLSQWQANSAGDNVYDPDSTNPSS